MGPLRRRCGHPPALAASGPPAKWPAGVPVAWYFDAATAPAGLGPDLACAHIALGVARWGRACGVDAPRVFDAARARVVVSFVPIDGFGSVLGLTQLPAGANAATVLWMHLDSAEDWGADPAMLEEAACHEFGHALGLGHAPTGVADIMSAYLDRTQSGPGPWSTAEAQARYGPPTPAPAPAPAPPAAPPVVLTFDAPAAGTYRLTLTLERSGGTP